MTLSDLLWPEGPARVALIGGGGKTTLMALAARESRESRWPLLISTTTRLQRPCPLGDTDIHLGDHAPPYRSERAAEPLLWVGHPVQNGEKWCGPPSVALSSVCTGNSKMGSVRVLLESDGSAGRPIKAPGEQEPVVPDWTDRVVAVVGLSALGNPVDEASVHRLKIFTGLTGASAGDVLTPEHILSLILHEKGSFKGVAPEMERILVLNQADDELRMKTGSELAEAAMAGMPELRSVAVTSFRNKPIFRRIVSK